MKKLQFISFPAIASMAFFTSCSTLDKVSIHGLTSGYYKMDSENEVRKVYLDVTDEIIYVHNQTDNQPEKDYFLSVPLYASGNLPVSPLKFSKQSLDIDITTILFKYRPPVYELPQHLTTDFNVALYAGWRHDNFKIISNRDPLGRGFYKISDLGYDFGFFAGPGATPVNEVTTNYRAAGEYNGMIVEAGFAGFLESSKASFGIAAGFDYLLNPDREFWIYHNKPWIGFVVGIAIN